MPNFAPSPGKTLLFIGQDKITIANYVKDIGLIPAGFTVYTSVQDADGLHNPADHGGGIHHMQYILDNYPNALVHAGLHMAGALEGIIKGAYDNNIDKLAAYFKSAKRPAYLRIGYEFDFPQNNYSPKEYVSAYKYIVDKFRSKNVGNIAYVWHSYAADITRPVMDWYPGDEYVDWFAISFFAQDSQHMDSMAKLSRHHNKPFMIAEATPQGIGTLKGDESWGLWFKRLFGFIEEKDARALCYINCRWDDLAMFKGQGWQDARVQANDIIRRNWIDMIKGDRYILSSDNLYELVGYKC